MRQRLFFAIGGLWLAFFLYPLMAAPPAYGALPDDAKPCAVCHRSSLKSWLETSHGKLFSSGIGNETGKGSCAVCHGDTTAHRADAKAKRAAGDKPDLSLITRLGPESKLSTGEKNAICMQCHVNNESQIFWEGSGHQAGGVACIDCHQGKRPVLPVKKPSFEAAKGLADDFASDAELCGSCHPQRRAMMMRSSHMPMREGKIGCSDCHNPHGGQGPANLRQLSVNENCYSCHAEKRGPMLWEHPPVREDCGNCHEAHGSNNPTLLKVKQPYLCQVCHMANYHPSELYTGEGIPAHEGAAKQQIYRGCVNCHPKVHGSNHPSGPRFTR